jgi:heat shock protein HslJ
MKNPILVPVFAVLILALAACAGSGSAQPDLDGTSWNLVSVNGKPVLADTHPTLNFDNGQASGAGSCNGFGAEYTLKGEKPVFGPVLSTMMACSPQEVMDQEQAFFSTLAATASYRVDGSRLTLLDAAGNVLAEFTAEK